MTLQAADGMAQHRIKYTMRGICRCLHSSSNTACHRLSRVRRDKRGRIEQEAAQKKVDILQKALRHHPDSEEIVLRLVTASQVFLEEADMQQRWQVPHQLILQSVCSAAQLLLQQKAERNLKFYH